MPLKLNQGDRRLLLAAAAFLALLLIAGFVISGGQGSTSEAPTSYSVASEGAKAAFLLLQESGYKTSRWEKPLTELPDPKNHILILAEPQQAPTQKERERLDRFISAGGKVIITGISAGAFLPSFGSIPDPVAGLVWKKYHSLTPSAITRAAQQITMAPQASWDRLLSCDPLYGDAEKVVAVKYHHGKGEVIWWAAATPLTNAGLKESGNMEFFLACLADGKEILWDEYIHGYRPTLGASVTHSTALWVLLQLGIIALAILATYSRRSGPVCAAASDVRLSPLEFVYTLGGLYKRAGAASVAVDIMYLRFRYWLTRRLGLAGNSSPAELEIAVRDRWHYSDESFASVLKQCESARRDYELNPKKALQLVQKLDSYAEQLMLFPASKEKDR